MTMACLTLLTVLAAQPNSPPPSLKVERAEWKTLFDQANASFKAKQYPQAEDQFRQALQKCKDAEKPRHARAFVLNGLAAALVTQKKYAEAEPVAAEAAECWIVAHGPEHPAVGRILSNLGNIRKSLLDFKSAEEAYRQALVAMERSIRPQKRDTLLALDNLARLYDDFGRDPQAVATYRRLLLMQFEELSTDPTASVSTLTRLSRCHLRQNQLTEAEPLARQALQVSERQLGANHPLYADSLACMAQVYLQQGNPKQALELAEKSLQIAKAAVGDSHDITTSATVVLASALRQTGDTAKARELYDKTLTSLDDSPPTARLAHLLDDHADLLSELGESELAAKQRDRAKTIRQSLGATQK